MNRKEIKQAAKARMKGNWKNLIVAVILAVLIPSFGFSIAFTVIDPVILILLGPIISIFVVYPLSIGLVGVYLDVAKGGTVELGNIFKGFNYWLKGVWLVLRIAIQTMLWSLLFIVPGYIKAIAYSQAIKILVDNPELSVSECIRRSRDMMDGYKMNYFIFGLSFFGWGILMGITFGLAGFYVIPYTLLAENMYYVKLKEEYAKSSEEFAEA
ncbi:hypothetical protein D3C81_09650 [compost metagenome]